MQTSTPSDDYFVPLVGDPSAFAPPVRMTVRHEPKKRFSGPVIAAAVVIVLLVGGFFAVRSSVSKSAPVPVVLAPHTPTAGLPTSLGDVVRMQAESSRHTAIQTMNSLGTGDIDQLTHTATAFQWVAGTAPSTAPTVVSIDGAATSATIAVAATNHDVCAFGRWTLGANAEYVTMAHLKTCRAVDAPADGWNAEAGGAASDLPDDNG
jgi:hypothetical protein